MSDTIKATFKCEKCGCTSISVANNPTEESIVSCTDCGHEFGTWGNLKKKFMEDTKKAIVGMAKDAFKNLR